MTDERPVTLADIILLVTHEPDEARVCVVCGHDATVRGVVLLDSYTVPQLMVSAWCDRDECRRDLAASGQTLTEPVPAADDDDWCWRLETHELDGWAGRSAWVPLDHAEHILAGHELRYPRNLWRIVRRDPSAPGA